MKRAGMRRLFGGWLSCGLAVGLFAFAASAQAAQIDLTNCQPRQVRICAWSCDFRKVDPGAPCP